MLMFFFDYARAGELIVGRRQKRSAREGCVCVCLMCGLVNCNRLASPGGKQMLMFDLWWEADVDV